MTAQFMSDERFLELSDSFGSEIDRWPSAEQAAARALLQHSTVARAALDAAAGLDAIFTELPIPAPPSTQLRRRILEAAPTTARLSFVDVLLGFWREIGGLSRAGPMLAASLALGVLLAPYTAPMSVDDEPMLQIALSDADYDEWVP